MFMVSGAIGICCIGFVGGYYFARFFDRAPTMTAPQLGTLLTLLGIGPTALALVQGYFKLSLLDPYGIGLLVGVLVNMVARYYASTLTTASLEIPAHSLTARLAESQPTKTAKPSFAQVVTATASASPFYAVSTRQRVGLVFDRQPALPGRSARVYEVSTSVVAPTSFHARMWLEQDLVGQPPDDKSARLILICESLDALNQARAYGMEPEHRSIAEAVDAAGSGWWIEADPGYVTRLLS